MTADEAAARISTAYALVMTTVAPDERLGELRRIVRDVFDEAERERDAKGETSDAGE